VLVDRYSASASEIFAGAIQDYGRGIVVGEPTYGKGTVQSLVDLDRFVRQDDLDLGQLKTTVAQFFRVSGDSTQHRGVLPDIRFPTSFDVGDHGERALDNALPWARLESAAYDPQELSPMELELLRERHEARLGDDPVFGLLLAEARERKRLRDRTTTTLVEARRRAQQAARQETREARSAELSRLLEGVTGVAASAEGAEGDDGASQEEAEADVWLREASRILADYVVLARDPGYRLVREAPQSAARTPSPGCVLDGC
jgi:carboxyl-terminal processing protease